MRDGATCRLGTDQIYCFGARNIYGSYYLNPDWKSVLECTILALTAKECSIRPRVGQIVVPVPRGRPMTIGDVVLYTGTEGQWNRRLDEERAHNSDMWLHFAQVDRRFATGMVDQYGRHVEAHEAIHADQWARHESVNSFLAGYGFESLSSYAQTAGSSGVILNSYEIEANLYWGGYKNLQW